MCRKLNFRMGERNFALEPTKVERKKLYGWTEMRLTTPDGGTCRQAGLDQSGQLIIVKGATKIGMLDEDGAWLERSELVAVHSDGREAEAQPSSFDQPIDLTCKASVEELLNLCVTATYQLSGDEVEAVNGWLGNDIYMFDFSYRGGYETSKAFLLSNGTTPFVITGEPMQFDFIGFDEQGTLTDMTDVDFEDDELDFNMM